MAESQAVPIHAYDQTETLLGQGTLARELSNQVPTATTVLVAVGGGGLIGGMAAWFAGQTTRVIGVEPVGAPTLTEALKAGRPVDAPAGSVAADSLAPRRVGELMFPIAQQHVERVCWSKTRTSCARRTCCGRYFVSPSSPEARPHSPPCLPGGTNPQATNTSPWSFAARTPSADQARPCSRRQVGSGAKRFDVPAAR